MLLVDYRLPGLDGVQVTKLVRERCPGVAVVALTAAAEERERQALIDAGASACIGKDRPLDEIIDAVRARPGAEVELNAENTAIVLDSTADFPEGPERFPNWRVVPLYVRFGDESFKDYVELSPQRLLRAAAELQGDCRRPPSRRPATSSRPTRSSARTTGSCRCTSRRSSRGRSRAPGRRARRSAAAKVRAIDSGTVSAGLALLALAVQRRLERGRPTRTSTRSSSAPAGRAASSSRWTRSSSCSAAAGSGRRRRWRGRS